MIVILEKDQRKRNFMLQQLAYKMKVFEEEDEKKYHVISEYNVSESGGKVYFHCCACIVTNLISDSPDEADIHQLSNLIHHRQTTLHQFKLQSLAGRKGKDNTIANKIFSDIEKDLGKNVFFFGEGYVTCRSCKNVKINLFGQGSVMRRIQDHVKGKGHKAKKEQNFKR